MYMKVPKQKHSKHAKIEMKKIKSQEIINHAVQQWKWKQKQLKSKWKEIIRNKYNTIYSIHGTTDNVSVTN